MRRATIVEPTVDLRAVASALEGAGYTITGVVETTLTPGTLHETTNPVIVLVNDIALQCVLVELFAEQSDQESWLASTQASNAWQAIACSAAARTVGGSRSTSRADGMLLKETAKPSIPSVMSDARSSGGQAAHPTPTARGVRWSAFRVMWALKQTRVTLPMAISHITAMAVLGGVSGYLLRSAWLLAFLPVAYVCAVILKVVGSPYAAGEAVRLLTA